MKWYQLRYILEKVCKILFVTRFTCNKIIIKLADHIHVYVNNKKLVYE